MVFTIILLNVVTDLTEWFFKVYQVVGGPMASTQLCVRTIYKLLCFKLHLSFHRFWGTLNDSSVTSNLMLLLGIRRYESPFREGCFWLLWFWHFNDILIPLIITLALIRINRIISAFWTDKHSLIAKDYADRAYEHLLTIYSVVKFM